MRTWGQAGRFPSSQWMASGERGRAGRELTAFWAEAWHGSRTSLSAQPVCPTSSQLVPINQSIHCLTVTQHHQTGKQTMVSWKTEYYSAIKRNDLSSLETCWNLKVLSVGELINKLLYMYTMGYYSAIERICYEARKRH